MSKSTPEAAAAGDKPTAETIATIAATKATNTIRMNFYYAAAPHAEIRIAFDPAPGSLGNQAACA